MVAKLVAAEEDQRMLVLDSKLRTHTMIHNKELNNSIQFHIYTFYIHQPTCTHPSFHHTTVNLHHHVRLSVLPLQSLANPKELSVVSSSNSDKTKSEFTNFFCSAKRLGALKLEQNMGGQKDIDSATILGQLGIQNNCELYT